MGKRSDFPRVPRDFYPTPAAPIHILSPHLTDVTAFGEPCIGDGRLADTLIALGHTLGFASDMEPTGAAADYAEARRVEDLTVDDAEDISHWITNPPWPSKGMLGEPTLGLIRHLSAMRPTWLLLSADFKHNIYAAEVLAYCPKIVSVGRVKWMEGSKDSGKDNAAWYLFDQTRPGLPAFYARNDHRNPTYITDIEDLL